MALEINSFLPVINKVSKVFCLSDNSIHIRGSVLNADLAALHAYAQRVGTFILTDASPDLKGLTIPPATYLRLAQLRSPPFFPSLKRLRIVDLKSSDLNHLNLLLTNSLRSIELRNIDHRQEGLLLSFLITLAEECRELSSIKLTSPIPTSVWENCLNFRGLRRLELKDVPRRLNFDLLLTIGRAFPQLQDFSLYARFSKYITPAITDTQTEGKNKRSPSGLGFTDAELAELHSDGRDDPASPSKGNTISDHPEPPSPFLRLEKLDVIGSLELIQDLVDSISSPCLKKICLTLVRSNRPKFPLDPRRIDLETPVFVACVEKVLDTWEHGLVNVVIGQYEDYAPLNCASSPSPVFPTLPVELCQKLVVQPVLKCLTVFGWTVESFLDYSLYSASTPPASSSLTTLHLQVDRTNEGISLSGLQFIAESFPSLLSLQSRIVLLDDSDSIPIYEPATSVLSHGLKRLSVGSARLSLSPTEVLDIARYIVALFPNLEVLETHEGQNEDQWNHIHRLIQAIQGVCLDLEKSPGSE